MRKTKSTSPTVISTVLSGKVEVIPESNRAKSPPRSLPGGVLGGAVQRAAILDRRDALVLEHVTLVRVIARNVHAKLPETVDLDDMIQAGMMGLFEAASKFDADRQDVFSIYAKHRIRGAILDSLRQLDWASRDIRRRHKQVEAAQHDLTAILLRSPTEAEVAEKLGVDMNRFHALMLDLETAGPVSADSRPNQGDDLPTMEFPSKPECQPDFICARKEMRNKLREAIRTLPERYQQVVQQYYAEDRSMKEIGGRLCVNESRVSQIHKKALEMMATVLTRQGITSVHAFQA